MKYLKKFQKESDYQSFVESSNFVTPNVSFAQDEKLVFYNPYEEPMKPSVPNNVITYTANSKLPEITYEDMMVEGIWVIHALTIDAFNRKNYFNEETYEDVSIHANITSHEFNEGIGTITFDQDITTIGYGAFAGCSGLTSIVIPDSVTTIEYGAFYECTSLPVEDNLRYVGTYLIEAVDKTQTSYTIKEGTKAIVSSAFEGCSSLTSINIPDSVTSIGGDAFAGCTSLPVEGNLRYADTFLVEAVDKSQTSYIIKEGTKWIGNAAFERCSSLTSIIIPDSVTEMGNRIFSACHRLTSVTIGAGVTSIGNQFIYISSQVSSITCYAPTAPKIQDHTFQEAASNGVLYYPVGSDYSSWLSTDDYYLGYYNWTAQEITD